MSDRVREGNAWRRTSHCPESGPNTSRHWWSGETTCPGSWDTRTSAAVSDRQSTSSSLLLRKNGNSRRSKSPRHDVLFPFWITNASVSLPEMTYRLNHIQTIKESSSRTENTCRNASYRQTELLAVLLQDDTGAKISSLDLIYLFNLFIH